MVLSHFTKGKFMVNGPSGLVPPGYRTILMWDSFYHCDYLLRADYTETGFESGFEHIPDFAQMA